MKRHAYWHAINSRISHAALEDQPAPPIPQNTRNDRKRTV